MTTRARSQASEGCTSLQEGRKQLLPGIPDEITLHSIVPKLPWKAFHILSSVSRAWLHGIRTRQVYDARVLSQSTETLVVVRVIWSGTSDCTTGGLISFREKPTRKRRDSRVHPACTNLPPIPYHCGEWASSEGYIYLLGGENNSFGERCGNKVFVFDVAGQRQWKECASMIEPRKQFGYRIMHGKVYVFGGVTTDSSAHDLSPSAFCGSEVYDPKEDRWSPIRPMTFLRCHHKVETVGDELVLHGGLYFDEDHFNARKVKNDDDSSIDSSDDEDDPFIDYNSDDEFHTRVAKFLEVYHPVKDEWRVVNPFGRENRDYLFGAGGKLYSIDWSSIHVYAGENSWTHLHSFSFPTSALDDSVMGKISCAIVVDGELLVYAWWKVVIDGRDSERRGQFQSKGFGGKSMEITWHKAPQFQIFCTSYPQSSNELIQL